MSLTNVVLLSDQMALMQSTDIIANNIANSSTTGFKREGIQFEDYLKMSGSQKTNYVYNRATYRDTSPGVITTTGNPLDLAIQGQGYFEVQTPSGATEYTRNGAFHLDNQGQIVTSANLPVLSDGGGPIIIPDEAKDITIGGDGFITAQVGTTSSRAQLGKIGVVTFDNDEAVVPAGSGLLTTTQTPNPNTNSNAIVEGAVEDSNVKPVLEITDLIRIQRAYEMATNIIRMENDRVTNAIDKLSQITS